MTSPSKVILLRHAEKPTEDGDAHLSPSGLIRAAALSVAIPQVFGAPDDIFAAAPSKKSVRPIETMTPLSHALQVQLRTKWADADYGELAGQILSGKYPKSLLVVCWHHGNLPPLASALGVKSPPAWGPAVFDRYWEIDFTSGEAQLRSAPQALLFGDERE